MKKHADQLHEDYKTTANAIPALRLETPFQLGFTRRFLLFVGLFNRVAKTVTLKTEKLGDVTVRVYQPKGSISSGSVLWVHGGGYVLGDPKNEDKSCSDLVEKLNCTVLSVKYRLAPEHPFPAAHEDLWNVWQQLCEPTSQYGQPKCIIGISAGGGLVAGLVQRLLNENKPRPSGIALLYPMLDPISANQAQVPLDYHRIWSRRNNLQGWQAYLGSRLSTPPPYATHTGANLNQPFPDTWMGVGEEDLFADECTRFQYALAEAGTQVTFETVAGAPHGFDQLNQDSILTQRFVESWYQFVAQQLD